MTDNTETPTKSGNVSERPDAGRGDVLHAAVDAALLAENTKCYHDGIYGSREDADAKKSTVHALIESEIARADAAEAKLDEIRAVVEEAPEPRGVLRRRLSLILDKDDADDAPLDDDHAAERAAHADNWDWAS